MVVTIILCVLFILLTVALVVFIFALLVPALKGNADLSYVVFPKEISTYPKSREDIYTHDSTVIASSIDTKESFPRTIRLNYQGVKSCDLFYNAYGSTTTWGKECIGFGTCQDHCPQKAIIIKDGTITITEDCIGCGLCIKACPKRLLVLSQGRITVDGPKVSTVWKSANSFILGMEKAIISYKE